MREISENPLKRQISLNPVPMVCHRGCPDRTRDCHATCERYKAYREACDLVMHERSLNSQAAEAVADRKRKKEKLQRKWR